jgi:hypothetical protein
MFIPFLFAVSRFMNDLSAAESVVASWGFSFVPTTRLTLINAVLRPMEQTALWLEYAEQLVGVPLRVIGRIRGAFKSSLALNNGKILRSLLATSRALSFVTDSTSDRSSSSSLKLIFFFAGGIACTCVIGDGYCVCG